MLLQEAKSSSEIENIFTTNDDLYQAFNGDPEKADRHTKEVLRYEKALWFGYQRIKSGEPFSPAFFTEIVRIIKDDASYSIRIRPGTRIVSSKTRQTIYAPPEGESLLRELLDNLAQYLQAKDGVDPLIKLAVAHYQFEAIHPYHDGNGRTGRLINVLYLVSEGLLDLPVLYLSSYIIGNKAQYYRGLREVTEEQRWEEWIEFMLEGIRRTSDETKDRLGQIRTALAEAIELARTQMQRGYSKELLELIFTQPYTRINTLESAGIAKRETASAYLKELERIGLLASFKSGREVLFVNPGLYEILTGIPFEPRG